MHGNSGTPVSLSSYGGLVTLADPSSIPEGASPRNYNMDFNVGAAKSRPGLTNAFASSNATAGPNPPTIASSNTWVNPLNIVVGDGAYTQQSPLNVPNTLIVQGFGFSVPTSDAITGVLINLTGYGNVSSCAISAQLLKNGVPVGTPIIVNPPGVSGVFPIGGLNELFGTSLTPNDVNNHNFGFQLTASSSTFPLGTILLDYATITLGVNTGGHNFNYIGTFTLQDGTIKNVASDAGGNLFIEDVTNDPGVRTSIMDDISPNSLSTGINGPDVFYQTFSDGVTGSDMPLQINADGTIDRLTQVGPGAAPTFSAVKASTDTFDIATITQNPPNSNILNPGHISVLLWSAGPGTTSPGNVLTVYYSPSFYSGAPQPAAEDKILDNAVNAGQTVIVYLSGMPFGDGVYVVTSIGNALPPGVDHFRYYFTVQMPTSSYQRQNEAPGQYQMSVATMTMTDPIPGLSVGDQATIAAASVAAYDATWTITQTLNSADMVITNTAVTASVATYSYSVTTGTPPAAGELVTVTGTTNANGLLNVTNATIATSTGGSTGTFTLSVPVVTASSSPETGLATTAGTIFQFDPGANVLGTTTSPIFGDSTGGTLTFVGNTATLIGPGTRKGTVFFITRNGYYTAPAPPVIFTCPEDTTGISATNIPIGPPNVVARGIAFTEAGQNGVPGANFFTIPTDVSYIVNNQTYTATSLIIQDNTSTSATFQFTDPVLLNALAIDVYGYNLFNQIEIGDPGWTCTYNSRNWFGLCRNKVQNFNNLSFDGGYLPSQQQGILFPLGWSTPSDQYGGLVASPRFGNAYYILNSSAGTVSAAGSISQSAFQDWNKQPIILPNTTYSVRVTARIPSGSITGNLVMSLTANGANYGQYVLPFASMTTDYGIYTGTLLTKAFLTVPSALALNVEASEIGAGADLEIDRIEIYPTAIPVLTTTIYGSYAGLPEQVDAVTGQVQCSNENQQPVNGGVVMYDTLYLLKGSIQGTSMYSLQASANLEPAQWDEPEVAQKSGSIGILAHDFGEQWIAMANRNGLYIFEGGQPGKITQEIYQVWDSIYWPSANKIWVKNDVVHRKLYVGLPMPTPNFWLPNAEVNLTPESPSVILMCNYQGLDSGAELKSGPQMHTTMFGTLNAIDMRRKWSLWDIKSPFANIVTDKIPTLTVQTIGRLVYYLYLPGPINEGLYICNGVGNSKIYYLDESNETDDGAPIDSLYTTAGLVEMTKRAQSPGLGSQALRWGYMVAQLGTLGTVNVRLLPNVLLGPNDSTAGYNAWTIPGGFSPGDPPLQDCEASLNFYARRTYFEFRENDGKGFSLSNLVATAEKDVWNPIRGRK